MKKIIVRPNGTKKVVTINEEPTMTQQQFKDQVNVNNIMKKYLKTGTITHLRNQQTGVYADLSEIPLDLHEARLAVQHADEAFQSVPSEIRAMFDNNADAFVSFLKDPANDDKAVELGLKARKEAPKPEASPAPAEDKK